MPGLRISQFLAYHFWRYCIWFYNSIPNPNVVEPSWKLLCKTLHETVIEENIFYTKQNGGKWITRSEALFAVFDQVGTADSLESSSHCIWCVACVL
jgi:hypothetical protein